MTQTELLVYERMQEAMIPLVQRHLVVITAFYDGTLHHHATGILVQFSGHHFLITAAHAIEDFHKGKTVYSDIRLLIDNGHDHDLVPLYGRYRATQTVRDREHPRLLVQDDRDDLWDIGIWDLDSQTVKALTNKAFLNRSDISIEDDLSAGTYFLAGCPCAWAKADAEVRSASWKWIRYISYPYAESSELPNFDGRFHMALCLGEERPKLPNDLKGISGCPIWKLSDVPIRDDWDVCQAKVVAIQTCTYSRAIRGTKWQYVLPILADMHPDIRNAFRLWIPEE